MIKEYEIKVWDALKRKDSAQFLDLVEKNALMVCGGDQCCGNQYADFVKEFDCKSYEITDFANIFQTDEIIQVHYIVKTEVEFEENKDLEGIFHVTSTWKKCEDGWKMIFNMDSRIA